MVRFMHVIVCLHAGRTVLDLDSPPKTPQFKKRFTSDNKSALEKLSVLASRIELETFHV